ncbi:hypothetical protein RAA17_00045 [Komagataeibacter rhaeticus]|nr:hypothetical protein [Komagataeibacter rhaeticus]
MGHAPLWRPVMPVAEGPLARPLAPSRPDDVALGPQPAVRSPLAAASTARARADREASRARALQRGQLVHALLRALRPTVPYPGGRNWPMRGWPARRQDLRPRSGVNWWRRCWR